MLIDWPNSMITGGCSDQIQPVQLATLPIRDHPSSHSSPRVINVDLSNAYPPAVEELKKEGVLPVTSQLRQCKYLNNLIEQDHRFIKRRVNPGLGFFSFNTAWRTIRGYEAMHMMRKGQIEGVGKGDIRGQIRFVSNLFMFAA
jgi:transposase, IS6 family